MLALGLFAFARNSQAQTNLLPVTFNAICTSSNATGLLREKVTNLNLIDDCAVENGLTVGCQGPAEHSEEYDRWRQANHSRCYFLATALPPMVRVTWGIGIPFSVINFEISATASA